VSIREVRERASPLTPASLSHWKELKGKEAEVTVSSIARAAGLLAVAGALSVSVAACGGKHHHASAASVASSARANPTVSADASVAKTEADAAVNRCVTQFGGVPAPGASALAQPAVLRHLLTRGGRETFIRCLTPDQAAQGQIKRCAGAQLQVFTVHPGAVEGRSSASETRRHAAEAGVFTCVSRGLK
jgi:hypothetical protein